MTLSGKFAKSIFIRLFPRVYKNHILEKRFSYSRYHLLQLHRISTIRKRGSANVVFILSSLPMWRLEKVYRLLKEDGRFRVHLVICPFRTFDEDQKNRSVGELRRYCLDKDYSFVDRTESEDDVIHTLNPDIIFYPQLYSHLFDNELDCEKNLDRLIAYVPYGLPTVTGEWMYNSLYMNTVWKLFFPTEMHLNYAKKHSFNRARNMEIVGDPHAADFACNDHSYEWKEQEREKKKVIWAPHFSIGDSGYLHRASFLWLHGIMWDLTEEYKDRIQFVFKPHPRLLSELYRHPDWGKEKADAYYEKWRTGGNTQLETGNYIDLFCTSDAMIHDCGSFSAEYLYTGRPVLFVSKDFPALYAGLDDFGTRCMDNHYHTGNQEGIHSFIRDVVLEGKDSLEDRRDAFRKAWLIPEKGFSFEQNVYNSLVDSLFKRR